MEILKSRGQNHKTVKIFGTTYRMPSQIGDFVQSSLRLMLNARVQTAGIQSNVTLEPKKCADMIDAHYLNLTR